MSQRHVTNIATLMARALQRTSGAAPQLTADVDAVAVAVAVAVAPADADRIYWPA